MRSAFMYVFNLFFHSPGCWSHVPSSNHALCEVFSICNHAPCACICGDVHVALHFFCFNNTHISLLYFSFVYKMCSAAGCIVICCISEY